MLHFLAIVLAWVAALVAAYWALWIVVHSIVWIITLPRETIEAIRDWPAARRGAKLMRDARRITQWQPKVPRYPQW